MNPLSVSIWLSQPHMIHKQNDVAGVRGQFFQNIWPSQANFEIDLPSHSWKFWSVSFSTERVGWLQIGHCHVVDASIDEEACCLARLMMAVTEKGTLTALKQAGSGSLDPESLLEMMQVNLTLPFSLSLPVPHFSLPSSLPPSISLGYCIIRSYLTVNTVWPLIFCSLVNELGRIWTMYYIGYLKKRRNSDPIEEKSDFLDDASISIGLIVFYIDFDTKYQFSNEFFLVSAFTSPQHEW